MRTALVAGALGLGAAGLLAGCPGGGGETECGNQLCERGEDMTCTDCTFEEMESLTVTVTLDDWQTAELQAVFDVTEADLVAAFMDAKPMNNYDFSGFGTRWIAAYMNNVDGLMTVRASGERDWLMVCQTPDMTTLFADDDFVTGNCLANGVASGDCDPGLNLMGEGLWLCLFGAAPAATNTDPVGSLTITASAM
jgi:hypothetical protein